MKASSGIVAFLTLGTTLLTGCGSPSASPHSQQKGHVYVAYAGSLQLLNDKYLGPSFQKATGITYQGQGGGAYGMAHFVASGSVHANVFESIGTGPLKVLGSRVPWAIGVASSPLVIAYSPSSPYAKTFAAIKNGTLPIKRLFQLMAQPGFHLGRTNPQTDPQGQAFYMMVENAQTQWGLPSGTAKKILGSLNNSQQIFAEESILSRLQSGQLDAASAFLSEAVQRHLDYISLPSSLNFGNPADAAKYAKMHLNLGKGKCVNGAPLEIYVAPLAHTFNASQANDFVHYMLSKNGIVQLQQEGFHITKPVVMGSRASMPSAITHELP